MRVYKAPKELPSLYTASRPLEAPPVDLQARRISASDHALISRTADTFQRGAAGTFLQDVLEASYKEAIKERRGAVVVEAAEDDEEERELREKGFVQKRKKRARSSSVGSMADVEETEEGGSDTEAAATLREKRMRGRRRTKRIKEALKVPEVSLEEPELSEGFPSTDLLSSIQNHATQLFETRHNLLPPLTLTNPLLPEPLVEHFDNLIAQMNDEEERVAREGKGDVWLAWKQSRISKAGAGTRKAVWTDVSRAFEGTALVALGMLTQLLVKDVVAQEAQQLPELPPDMMEQDGAAGDDA
ncbi:hypothetical protein NBRC10512_003830 [Rhodotorula toruloides]|uniref:RHTO0S02e04962g1_1 n=2 Tax=Rhodotorula toruloides TaxID=5286 RepID=A0A061AGH2_RHOTO|nr:uncharacterized protein RHTO_01152 [Rhodotorula toruloides NP11]EMS21937.1 hypothetical protein RHTO_01152 [Rhodotorula toruloides NP11]CDR36646.1 RHTO0S02e04962g1_1 [Rhodotorula toruloides]